MESIFRFESEAETLSWDNVDALFQREESSGFMQNPLGDPDLLLVLLTEALVRLGRQAPLVQGIERTMSYQLQQLLEKQEDRIKMVVRNVSPSAADSEETFFQAQSDLLRALLDQWFEALFETLRNHSTVLSQLPGGIEHDSYTLPMVWEKVQHELCIKLAAILNTKRVSISSPQDRVEKLQDSKLTFSFHDSEVESSAKSQNRGQKRRQTEFAKALENFKSSQWIQPSPYLAVVIQEPIKAFKILVDSLLDAQKVEKDHSCIDHFVSGVMDFLPKTPEEE